MVCKHSSNLILAWENYWNIPTQSLWRVFWKNIFGSRASSDQLRTYPRKISETIRKTIHLNSHFLRTAFAMDSWTIVTPSAMFPLWNKRHNGRTILMWILYLTDLYLKNKMCLTDFVLNWSATLSSKVMVVSDPFGIEEQQTESLGNIVPKMMVATHLWIGL